MCHPWRCVISFYFKDLADSGDFVCIVVYVTGDVVNVVVVVVIISVGVIGVVGVVIVFGIVVVVVIGVVVVVSSVHAVGLLDFYKLKMISIIMTERFIVILTESVACNHDGVFLSKLKFENQIQQ